MWKNWTGEQKKKAFTQNKKIFVIFAIIIIHHNLLFFLFVSYHKGLCNSYDRASPCSHSLFPNMAIP